MMKKVWPVLLAVVLVFGFAVLGCGGDSGTTPGDGDETLVDTLVFDMETDARIQGLDQRAIPNSEFAGSGNPISPLRRAGEDEHIAVSIVDNDGKNAIQYRVVSGTWGVGIDLPYTEFGFREGDEITVVGKVVTGTVELYLNCNIGSENVIAKQSGVSGDFELHVAALTAAQATQAKNGSPSGIRISARVAGVTVQINNITINGKRPAEAKPLATPEISLLEDSDFDDLVVGIEWTAVTGAGGYDVYYAPWAETIDDDDYEFLTTAAASATSVVLYGNADLTEGEDYSIYIVAKGVSGASLDSAKSNAVKYTKVTPANPEIDIEVDGTPATVELFAVGGKVVANDDGDGYIFTKTAGYGSSYAYFAVDFGTDRLSDFGKVTFTYAGVTGDIGWKRISLIASNTAFSGSIPAPASQVNANVWGGSSFAEGPQMNGTSDTSVTFIIPKVKADLYSGSTVYFSIYLAAAATGSDVATVMKFTDIAFVKESGAVTGGTITSIGLKTPPTKDIYDEDETFDPAGLVITANYLYGTTPETGYAEDVTYAPANAGQFTFADEDDTAITTSTVLFDEYPDSVVKVKVTYSTKTSPTFDLVVGDASDPFNDAVGLKTGIGAQNKAVFDSANGIIDLTDTSDSKLFTLDLPSATSDSGTKVITIEYVAKVTSGSHKLYVKDGGWGDVPTANKGDFNTTVTLVDNVVSTLEIPEKIFTDGKTTISFQDESNGNSWKIKFISVTME